MRHTLQKQKYQDSPGEDSDNLLTSPQYPLSKDIEKLRRSIGVLNVFKTRVAPRLEGHMSFISAWCDYRHDFSSPVEIDINDTQNISACIQTLSTDLKIDRLTSIVYKHIKEGGEAACKVEALAIKVKTEIGAVAAADVEFDVVDGLDVANQALQGVVDLRKELASLTKAIVEISRVSRTPSTS